MASMAFFALAVAALAAYGLYWRYPQATRRWFERVNLTRRVLWTLFLLGVVVVLLQSGIPSMIFVGALVFGYAVLYILFEQPHETVRDALGI